MIIVPQSVESLTLILNLEIHVKASLQVTFDALLDQVGPYNETPEGRPLPLKVEPWPGGRWYRDLGDNNGHLWGHVQAIKRPTLLEFTGPLFASYPFVNNMQYRLTEADGGITIAFRHTSLGFIQDDFKSGMNEGDKWILERTRRAAEAR